LDLGRLTPTNNKFSILNFKFLAVDIDVHGLFTLYLDNQAMGRQKSPSHNHTPPQSTADEGSIQDQLKNGMEAHGAHLMTTWDP
jgi:subtilase family serine protease